MAGYSHHPASKVAGSRQGGFDDHSGSSGVETVFGNEILQYTSLRKLDWPEHDPTAIAQPHRSWNLSDFDLLKASATHHERELPQLITRLRRMNTFDAMLNFLSSDAVNFNAKAGFRQESVWRERLRATIDADAPIEVVCPMFCKIGNWAKVMESSGPTAGELGAILSLASIAEWSTQIYAPGIVFRVLCDSELYNTAFLNTPPETRFYVREVQRLAATHTRGRVEISDYVDLIDDVTRFREIHARRYAELRQDPLSTIDRDLYDRLFESTRASINTRHLGMDYDQHRRVFGREGDNPSPLNDYVDEQAKRALADQLAVKLAVAESGVVDARFPRHIRASIHKGKKYGVNIIGLRIFPRYYRDCRLLPYHGMPLISMRNGLPSLTIAPEVVLRGRPDLVRLTQGGKSYCYILG